MEYKAPWFRDEFERGIEKGMQRGSEKTKRETALAFLRNGVDIDIVVKSTGFTREEVEKMAETVH